MMAAPPPTSERYVGLMSGTSLDGIDAILMTFEGEDPRALSWRVDAFETTPWPESTRDAIRGVLAGAPVRELSALHVDLARGFADAVRALLARAGVSPHEVRAIGSHGQTLWHEPSRGVSLQLGDPSTLAERTGIPVVSDFRARDVAAGGEGAPLVPWADLVLLHRPGVGRALQNLGGMGNVTWLPPCGDPARVRAFDTGPGVALLDAAARRASGGTEPWDLDGQRARRGRVHPELLARCLAHPFLALTPPRSTGRETFGEPYLDTLVDEARALGISLPHPDADAAARASARAGARAGAESAAESAAECAGWDDLLATLTAFTATSVAAAVRAHLPMDETHTMVLSGGGARNPALVDALRRALNPLPVEVGEAALGIDPDAREAAAFALLAWAHLHGVPGNLPQVTGASGPRVLGTLTPGPATPVSRTPDGPSTPDVPRTPAPPRIP
jgi:anhydro-N-acetylmuramic acid kinase